VKQFFLSGAAIGALALAAPAGAQVSTAEAPPAAAATQARRATTYDAAFFAPFAPRSALDIARRVPGFQIDQGNSDIRGFAGAAGNVVFNGARPSSKSESLETLLARIPARRVIRVELGPGDLYGSEYSGKSQVLNVILSAGSGLDGSMTASARRLWTGLVVPNLSGTVLLKRGDAGGEEGGSRHDGRIAALTAKRTTLVERTRAWSKKLAVW
jgi:ABC-type amino acid transport substrate-binding protein